MKRTLYFLTIVGFVALATLRAADEPTAIPTDTGWDTYRERFQVTQRAATSLGAGSCSSSNCHGGATPRPGEVFLGNEWHLWYDGGKGPHFRAYKVLYEGKDNPSNRMAELLYGPGSIAKKRAECLACHALDVEPTYQGRSHDLQEGVTCEACHGLSGDWQGAHQNPRVWRQQMSVEERTEKGYYDTRDLIHRTEKCLECHLGTASKSVTHEMMAAGHPALTFELVSDTKDIPKHWNDQQSYLPGVNEGSYFHAREWAVGQLVTLRESMYRLIDRTSRSGQADYALFECSACHHAIGEAWRQRRELQGTIGEPLFDLSNWAMCEPLVETFALGQRKEFRNLINEIVHHFSPRGGDLTRVREAAIRLATMTDELARKIAATVFDESTTSGLIGRIVKSRRFIAGLGYRSATQAFLASRALYCESVPGARCCEPVPGAQCEESDLDEPARIIALLHDDLFDEQGRERDGDYDPTTVVEHLERLGDLLGKP